MKKGLITRIHWNRIEKKWTKKTSKGCPRYSYLLLTGGWKTEVKPHFKRNPKAFVVTNSLDANVVTAEEAATLLAGAALCQQLLYNKANMTFNINEGETLLFTPAGAYILA